jgi:hypothetical protein
MRREEMRVWSNKGGSAGAPAPGFRRSVNSIIRNPAFQAADRALSKTHP